MKTSNLSNTTYGSTYLYLQNKIQTLFLKSKRLQQFTITVQVTFTNLPLT